MKKEKADKTEPKELTVTELKALIYDQMVIAEQAQRNIQALNAEIAKRTQKSNGITEQVPT